MQMEEALNQFEHKFEGSPKKRFACSHCGKTWVEIVGVFSLNTGSQEDVYFRLGDESETCQNCAFRVRTCPACGSKDAYEINLPSAAQEEPLSFNRIRIVSKT
jgi:hypothetical protein